MKNDSMLLSKVFDMCYICVCATSDNNKDINNSCNLIRFYKNFIQKPEFKILIKRRKYCNIDDVNINYILN